MSVKTYLTIQFQWLNIISMKHFKILLFFDFHNIIPIFIEEYNYHIFIGARATRHVIYSKKVDFGNFSKYMILCAH